MAKRKTPTPREPEPWFVYKIHPAKRPLSGPRVDIAFDPKRSTSTRTAVEIWEMVKELDRIHDEVHAIIMESCEEPIWS